MLHHQRFSVSYDYPVYFESGIFDARNPAFVAALTRREPGRCHRVAFVVEERVADLFPRLLADIEAYCGHHGRSLALAGAPRVVPGGEACKNDPRAPEGLAAWLDALGMDRQSFVVIVGGGALQDLVGYAAAITHRGVRAVRVPTTVLSQNDSGVGVKNGVNAFGKKNFLGTFAPPFAVLSDVDFLGTLEPRDKISGMAEAVKVALVKDPDFFEWLVEHAAALARFEMTAVSELVRRSAILHLSHIAGGGDPFELGSSRPLDFGHWSAHKLESLSDYALRHGEAVSIGIALDTYCSVELGLFRDVDAERVLALLDRIGLPVWDARLDDRGPEGKRRILDGVREFREHLGGDLTLMMLAGLGKGCEVRALPEPVIERAIDRLRARRGTGDAAMRPRSTGRARRRGCVGRLRVMQIATPGRPHISYCTNIHPAESLAETRTAVEDHVARVKLLLGMSEPFGVGLRLSARAATELDEPAALAEFQALLAHHGLYVFTVNGFPFGAFHGERVKEAVYRPDWLEPERVAYTDRLARLLARLLPEGTNGSISTVPGAFRARAADGAAAEAITRGILAHAAALLRIREQEGKLVELALEPEPCCFLETVEDVVRFFEQRVFTREALGHFSALTGTTGSVAEDFLRRHVGVCVDACHLAVEFEDARAAISRLRGAGIRVGKIQVTSALRVELSGNALRDEATFASLARFDDGVYLHQVVERSETGIVRHLDLPDAMAASRAQRSRAEWRVHFHVPVFAETLGAFASTQPFLRDLLDIVKKEPTSEHLEVETYTWDVLPEEHRGIDVDVAITRELAWTLRQLGQPATAPRVGEGS